MNKTQVKYENAFFWLIILNLTNNKVAKVAIFAVINTKIIVALVIILQAPIHSIVHASSLPLALSALAFAFLSLASAASFLLDALVSVNGFSGSLLCSTRSLNMPMC